MHIPLFHPDPSHGSVRTSSRSRRPIGTRWRSAPMALFGPGEATPPDSSATQGASSLARLRAQVPGLSNVVAISAGGTHSLALRSDGTVWAWGKNSYGELGYTGCTSPCPTPTQVSGLPGVVAIAVGRNHSLGLASDGTVWTWGLNSVGQLGNATCTYPSPCPTPTQVSGLSSVVAIEGGEGHSLALDSDGDVWAWGYNGTGSPRHGWLHLYLPNPDPRARRLGCRCDLGGRGSLACSSLRRNRVELGRRYVWPARSRGVHGLVLHAFASERLGRRRRDLNRSVHHARHRQPLRPHR